MVDFIVIALLLLILGGAAVYLYKAKKRGVKCIGCPDSAGCSGHCSCCTGDCCSDSQEMCDKEK